MTTSGWRVKLYQLAKEGAWIDHGTGHVSCKYVQSLGGLAIVVINENDNSTLLQSRVQHEDIYERQGESIIMWREAEPEGDIDYALSFQDTAGCLAIWEAISEVQTQHSKPSDYMRMSHIPSNAVRTALLLDTDGDHGAMLPECNVENIPDIRDRLSTVHPSLRESYVCQLVEKDKSYIRKLLSIFADMEDLDNNEILVKIAEISRSMLFMNDSSILEFVLQEDIFIKIAGALEYDPALKVHGDYRDYLTRRARHVEVVPIEDATLKSEIGLLFRMKYLRDIMLRPTIEDTGVSTLNSMIGFTTADICSKVFENVKYMGRILRIIKPSIDISAICPDASPGATSSSRAEMEKPGAALKELLGDLEDDDDDDDSMQVQSDTSTTATVDKSSGAVHRQPKRKRDDDDAGMESSSYDESEISVSTASTIKVAAAAGGGAGGSAATSSNGAQSKRTQAIRFVRELFFLTRSLSVDRRLELYSKLLNQMKTQFFEVCQSVLADPYSSETERLLISEALACVAVICPGYLRQYILEGPVPSLPSHLSASNRPPPPQLAGSAQSVYATSNSKCLLYVIIRRVVSENDSAIIEQLGDTVKVLIDPERLDRQEKDRFLGVFYDFYIHWLITPFVEPKRTDQFDPTEEFEAEAKGTGAGAGARVSVPYQDISAVSTSRRFLFDILSLCVHGHTYRMKYFIMRNSLIARVLRVFDSPQRHLHVGAVKFIRMILNMKDEFYYRHIVKLDLFRPILLVLKSASKRDNLVTSAIAELIEFIRTEGIRTVADYIVEKHADCFEGIHVGLLEKLMIRYEQGQDRDREMRGFGDGDNTTTGGAGDDVYGPMPLGAGGAAIATARQAFVRSGRKSNDRENEDAYFFTDDDDDGDSTDSSSSSGSGVEVNLDNEKVGRGRSSSLNLGGGPNLSSMLLDERAVKNSLRIDGEIHSGFLSSLSPSKTFSSFTDVPLDDAHRAEDEAARAAASSDPLALISSYADGEETEEVLSGGVVVDSPRSPSQVKQLEQADDDDDHHPPLPPLKSKFELDDEDAGLESFIKKPLVTANANGSAGTSAGGNSNSNGNGTGNSNGSSAAKGLTFRLKSNLGPKTIKFVSKGSASPTGDDQDRSQ